jgi:hypothetical protein
MLSLRKTPPKAEISPHRTSFNALSDEALLVYCVYYNTLSHSMFSISGHNKDPGTPLLN